MATLILTFVLSSSAILVSPPKFAANENNVMDAMPTPNGNPPAILLLGVMASSDACESAASAPAWNNATSWTYHHCDFPVARSGNYSCRCYVRTDGHWAPAVEEKIDSGFLRQPPSPPCKSPLDCGLNGECISGKCVCDKGWRGWCCGSLDLLPVNKSQRGLLVPGTVTRTLDPEPKPEP